MCAVALLVKDKGQLVLVSHKTRSSAWNLLGRNFDPKLDNELEDPAIREAKEELRLKSWECLGNQVFRQAS